MYICLENYSERAHQKGAPLKLSRSPDERSGLFTFQPELHAGFLGTNACQGLSKSHHKFNR